MYKEFEERTQSELYNITKYRKIIMNWYFFPRGNRAAAWWRGDGVFRGVAFELYNFISVLYTL